jgi:LCP family protein required for cell wall assembly
MRLFRANSTGGLVGRFVLLAVLVTGAVAATTAVAGLLQVQTIVDYLSVHPPIQARGLVLPKPGEPQTILLIGSDHRALTPYNDARTDTMLLVRLNAKSSTINVMSLPRDLQVNIPGYYPAKLNAAYSLHGPGLLIKTIRDNVFPQFKPNHIVDVNFAGFAALVNTIGCVYSDVDHRYFNQSALGVDDFASINIQPGYQRLCGGNNQTNGALSFVRFRHTDSDITREARQQDFIRWAKSQYPVGRLVANRDHLAKIFGDHSQTDKGLHSLDGAIELIDLIENMESNGATIKQIPFPAEFTPCPDPCTVVPTSTAALRSKWAQFMRATPTPSPKPASSHKRPHTAKLSTTGLTADPADGSAQAAALSHAKLPVYYPRLIAADSSYCSGVTANCNDGDEPATAYTHSYPRAYQIIGPDGTRYPAYRITLVLNYTLGEFYGVQGTSWNNPPLLASPSATKTSHGRELFLYKDGSKLTQVAWHHNGNAYWISNNITENLPNNQMLEIAASLTRHNG